MAKQALSKKRKYWLIGLSLVALLVLAFIISVQINQPESTPPLFEYLDILAHPEKYRGQRYIGLWGNQFFEEKKTWLYPAKYYAMAVFAALLGVLAWVRFSSSKIWK